MVGISVSADVKKAKKQLSRIQRKQIPFALSRAINDSLEDAKKAEMGAIRNHIDRPTPWTMRGFKVNRSHKTRLHGSLEIQPSQWSYLKYQIQGGTSRRAGKPHAIPSGVATNKYGGMTRNKVRTLLRQKGTFIATIGGVKGVFKRTRAGRKLLVVFKETTQHRRRYPFGKASERVIRAKFKHNLDRRLKQALATAR